MYMHSMNVLYVTSPIKYDTVISSIHHADSAQSTTNFLIMLRLTQPPATISQLYGRRIINS